MTNIKWTTTQEQRLIELGLSLQDLPDSFTSNSERNSQFQKIEKEQVKKEKAALSSFLQQGGRVGLEQLSEKISEALCTKGFTRVTTPVIVNRESLEKMTIDADHPLTKQVYWISQSQCLRPMLAPNLYTLMAGFSRQRTRPVRYFEIGPCFRKESDGRKHKSEFTMLNLVELGTPLDEREARLKELATLVAETAGLDSYKFESEKSEVYGTTVDLVSGSEDIEVASGAMGPHPLDIAWSINESWVGLGFGLERLLMTSAGETSIGRFAKNLSYVNGIRLSL